MVWFKKNYLFVLILILVIIILLQKCGNEKIKPSLLIHDTIQNIDTTYVNVIKNIPTYIPKYKTKIQYIYDSTKIIDTVYIINDYNSTYFYKDSLVNDTIHLYVSDSISKNKIKSRNVKYNIKYPTLTITNNVVENKNELYYGLNIAGSKQGINSFGPELMLRTKQKSSYGLGLAINGSLQPIISFKIYWKIGKK